MRKKTVCGVVKNMDINVDELQSRVIAHFEHKYERKFRRKTPAIFTRWIFEFFQYFEGELIVKEGRIPRSKLYDNKEEE